MIPAIKAQFTPEILEKAANLYGVDLESLHSLGGFESFVYEYKKGDYLYILKLTHTLRRSKDYIMGEIEYLLYLDAQGVSVSVPVTSENGQYIETISAAEGDFLTISYIKAEGHRVTKEDWNDHLFTRWGQTMGRIHRVAGDFRPSSPNYRRQDWKNEDQLNVLKYIPDDQEVHAKVKDLLEVLESFPKHASTYGLVHEDFHHGNFFITKEGKLTVFDFDDSSYTYFINDISIAMYYATQHPAIPFKDQAKEIEALFVSFMKGYNREHRLEPTCFRWVDSLIRLRHTLMYVVIHATTDVTKLDEKGKIRLAEHREQILSTERFVPVHFETLVSEFIEKG